MKLISRGKRRAGAVALAAVVGVGVGVPTAATRADAAQQSPLTKTNRSCAGSVLGAEQPQPFGFVNLTRTASDKLIASVVLKGGPPGTTYDIRLIQLLPGNEDCGSATVFDGTLTTDDLGNGNANIQEPVLPGATSVWVDLNNAADFGDFFDTTPTAF